MNTPKIPVNLKVNGNVIPFKLRMEHESIYREASEVIAEGLVQLQKRYGDKLGPEKLLSILAVEMVVDALKAQSNYESLQKLVDQKVDEVISKFSQVTP